MAFSHLTPVPTLYNDKFTGSNRLTSTRLLMCEMIAMHVLLFSSGRPIGHAWRTWWMQRIIILPHLHSSCLGVMFDFFPMDNLNQVHPWRQANDLAGLFVAKSKRIRATIEPSVCWDSDPDLQPTPSNILVPNSCFQCVASEGSLLRAQKRLAWPLCHNTHIGTCARYTTRA